MRLIFLHIFLLFSAAVLQAQSGETRIVPRISALTPALGVEIPTTDVVTVMIQGSLGLSAEVVNTPTFIQTQIIVTPQVSIQPRYYFDLLARQAEGKDVTDFSADYFTLDINAGRALTQTGSFNRLVLNPAIGLQRSFGRRSYVSIHAGPSLTLGNRLFVQGRWLGIAGQINLGWRLVPVD